jgi:hypothetical protein
MAAVMIRARGSYMKMQAPVQDLHELRLVFAMARFRKVAEYNLLGQIQIRFHCRLTSSLGR